MTGIAVIDGDIIAYRCAAANEKREVVAIHNETLESTTYKTMTEFKGAVQDPSEYTVTPIQTAQPIENALHSIKRLLASITEKAKCSSYHVVVSGADNFRLELPLPTKYKGGRTDNTKPLQLSECKQYLINVHEAEVSEGVEADDILVGYMHQGYIDKEYIVQCSLDKDAKHGAGWLFDWTTMEEPELIEGYGALTLTLRDTGKKNAKGLPVMEKIIKGKGRAFLWYQLVFGDPVDTYKPCELAKKPFGEVGAYNLLKDATNDFEALTAVVGQYKYWYPEPVTYYDWAGKEQTKDWLELMQMYADCCFMRRYEGDRLDMKKLLTKLGVEH